MKKRNVFLLGLGLFVFGVGASVSAKPATCQSCYNNYQNCLLTGGSDCGAQFQLCYQRLCV